ncbi:hypothetical protein ACFE04_023917 [Oxalis oulophora]
MKFGFVIQRSNDKFLYTGSGTIQGRFNARVVEAQHMAISPSITLTDSANTRSSENKHHSHSILPDNTIADDISKDENLPVVRKDVSDGHLDRIPQGEIGCGVSEHADILDNSLEHMEDSISLRSTEHLGLAAEHGTENSTYNNCVTPTKNSDDSKSSKKKSARRCVASSDRVLRTRSQEKPTAPEPIQLANECPGTEDSVKKEDSAKKRKNQKKKKMEGRVTDEYSKIRAQVKYILKRINYEQSLIDAYSGDGWKGLSLDKLKPEKELQRATSEILRRKLKIRDLFQRLDSLCAEGRLPESLFDSDGEIDSDDIFCAKCGSKDLSLENDIILCDGFCDRGFHQFCLEPPLLKEDIPPGDEGWLCPACDCKDDCLDLLNESLGTNLLITDNWEKVCPEATAGDNQDPNFGLPSDDSDDNDYEPDGPKCEVKDEEDESSSDDSDSSDFTSASDEMGTPPNDEQFLGLPSDDSEDDDYNPDAPGVKNSMKEESSSSDFESDSEDDYAGLIDEVSSGKDGRSPTSNPVDPLEANPDQCVPVAISAKRSIERLDYKKLYDQLLASAVEAENVNASLLSCIVDYSLVSFSRWCLIPVLFSYLVLRLFVVKDEYGEDSYHSSEDEDFNETNGPRKKQKNSVGVAVLPPNGNVGSNSGTNAEENTSNRRTRGKKNLKDEDPANSNESSPKLSSDGKKPAKRLGEHVTQRLYQSFKENQYPDRSTKINLAKEVDLTFEQVNRWFVNTRWTFHHSQKTKADLDKMISKMNTSPPTTKDNPVVDQNNSSADGAKNENDPTERDTAVTKSGSTNAKGNVSANQDKTVQESTPRSTRNRKKGKMVDQALNPASKNDINPNNLPKDQDTPSSSRNLRKKKRLTDAQKEVAKLLLLYVLLTETRTSNWSSNIDANERDYSSPTSPLDISSEEGADNDSLPRSRQNRMKDDVAKRLPLMSLGLPTILISSLIVALRPWCQ